VTKEHFKWEIRNDAIFQLNNICQQVMLLLCTSAPAEHQVDEVIKQGTYLSMFLNDSSQHILLNQEFSSLQHQIKYAS
jgi:hypothetical protein